MPTTTISRFALTLSIFAAACDTSTETGSETESETGEDTLETDEIDRTTETVVDARDETKWVYLDLESGHFVVPNTPEDTVEWDLAFQRFNIAVNGGTSGSGGVEVAALEGEMFASVIEAPSSGYITDNVQDKPEDMETTPGYAFDLWYDYNPSNHILTPRELVYVVRTVEGNFFKVQLLDYYDEAGTSGYVHVIYEDLEG
ncbi:MAG: HmuY family protein [Nannocystaceae bacterium]